MRLQLKIERRFDPGQRRDTDGKWSADLLGLAARISLEPGEVLESSGRLDPDDDNDTDILWAVTSSGRGRQARISVQPRDAVAGWTGDDEYTTRLNRRQARHLHDDLTEGGASGKKTAAAVDKQWSAGEHPGDDVLTKALASGSVGDLRWEMHLTDDEPTSYLTTITVGDDTQADGLKLYPKDLRRFLKALGDLDADLSQTVQRHLPGLHNQQSHGRGLDANAMAGLYGDVYDEANIGDDYSVVVFERGDFGIFIDQEDGGRQPFLDGLTADGARDVADALERVSTVDIPDDAQRDPETGLVDWEDVTDDIRVGYDHAGDVSIVLPDDRIDLGVEEAQQMADGLYAMADRADELEELEDPVQRAVSRSGAALNRHLPGVHDQSKHGRRFNIPGDRNSGFRKTRQELKLEERARDLDELKQLIAVAQRKAAEVAKRNAAPDPPMAKPTATPTRMTKGQYTKLLKDEHIRLRILSGDSEREAKAAARPAASIDQLKARNADLRRQLRAAGVDHRTDEQRNTDDAEKGTLLDEVQRLAAAGGHDGAAKRNAASRMTVPELRKFVADTKEYQRRQAEKVRQAKLAQQDAVAREEYERQRLSRPATPRQVDYIMNLLRGRRNSTDMGGFFRGPTDRPGVASLTQGEASMYINSLTENY